MLEHSDTARGLEVGARFAVEKHFSVLYHSCEGIGLVQSVFDDAIAKSVGQS